MGNSNSSNRAAENLPSDFPEDVVFFHLSNLTNTCYCNSVLQAFLFSTNITNYFTNLSYIQFPNELTNSPLYHFLQIFKQKLQYNHFLLDEEKRTIARDIYIRPSAFLESIFHETNQFIRNQQNDSHEFLLYLVSSFDKTISQLKKKYSIKEKDQIATQEQTETNVLTDTTNDSNNLQDNTAGNDAKNNINASILANNTSSTINSNNNDNIKNINLISLFSLLFEGKRSSSFECACCHHTQEKIEKFTYLDIGIPLDSNKELDLQHLLDFSVCPDNISAEEGGWVCDGCKEKGVNVEIFFYIKNIPKTLLIQLQRFKYSKQTQVMEKINRFVRIQNEIHLNSGDGPKKYTLKSMICHIGGSLYQGHFVAIHHVQRKQPSIESSEDFFILASDSTVKIINQATVDALLKNQTQNGAYTPYVLLYEISN